MTAGPSRFGTLIVQPRQNCHTHVGAYYQQGFLPAGKVSRFFALTEKSCALVIN